MLLNSALVHRSSLRHLRFLVMSLICLSVSAPAISADNPFAGGWNLDPQSSTLTFQSIKEKNGPKPEISRFATFSGQVDQNGLATLRIQLDSVDTQVDLRNVRMRFLFFETFQFPEAVVTSQVSPATMTLLQEKRRLVMPVEFTLDLHGVTRTLSVDTTLTLFADDRLSIASVAPVEIQTALFNLEEGVRKLQDAAKVKIVPSGAVSFDLVFVRMDGGNEVGETALAMADVAAPSAPAVRTGAAAALESTGELTNEECFARFDILSETGAIYFRVGSSRLDANSVPLLTTVTDIVNRCPSLDIVVAGHTDSAGSEQNNLQLSIARANSVMQYLVDQGIDGARVTAIGFGEARPVAPNDTARNRSRNRRIEFTATSS